jgi:hypothetical protein
MLQIKRRILLTNNLPQPHPIRILMHVPVQIIGVVFTAAQSGAVFHPNTPFAVGCYYCLAA